MPVKKIFLDDRGWSIHDMFPDLRGGQINYSVLFPGIVKAWHRHKIQTDYFCVVMGNAQVAVHDQDACKTETHFMGELNPSVLVIPPKLWHGYIAIGNKPCGLIYYMTERYNAEKPDEERAPWDAFGYEWAPKNR